MRQFICFAVVVLSPFTAHAVDCDGTELVCLNMSSKAEVEGAGGKVVGGDLNADGFKPSPGGGVEFNWGSNVDLSKGAIEFDVTGLLPIDGEELAGGKVSLFSFCGVGSQDNKYIGFQKMPPDYHQGHIFRYGMDDDGLADNWDAVIITSTGMQCPYSIANPAWKENETHHIYATWGPSGLTLLIDGKKPCNNPATGKGNGDTFDPAKKFLVLGGRCQYYAAQTPKARISNLRIWGNGNQGAPSDPVPQPDPCSEGCGPGFKCVDGKCTCGPSPNYEVVDGACLPSCGALIGAMNWADGQCCPNGCANGGHGPNGTWDCNYCCKGANSCASIEETEPSSPPREPPADEPPDPPETNGNTDADTGADERKIAAEADQDSIPETGDQPEANGSLGPRLGDGKDFDREPVKTHRRNTGCATGSSMPVGPLLGLLMLIGLFVFRQRRRPTSLGCNSGHAVGRDYVLTLAGVIHKERHHQ